MMQSNHNDTPGTHKHTLSILTLFPQMFKGALNESILGRDKTRAMVDIRLVNIRDFATDKHKSVDDRPYGGDLGMILRVDVVDRALSYAKESVKTASSTHSILLDPGGETYSQRKAESLARIDHIILVCGHYEGVDDRVRSLVDEEISIGDYVVTGGEIPAMVIVDSVIRLIPGVLRDPKASTNESFSMTESYLEYPQFTRPQTYHAMDVPDILLSGHHKDIQEWRVKQSVLRTKKRRPDLLPKK